MKRCFKCGRELPESEFHKSRRSKDGPALSVATAPSRMATKWDNTAMAGVIYITENFGEEE